ncbi:MAG: hypothetical protein SFY68_09675 [Candidatus Sumerlaeia bacterium]|nr:hypothetical protein [Candidatus Sumerlaeia bacterium]
MANESQTNSPKNLGNVVFFVLAMVALGWLAFSMFKPAKPLVENSSPEALMDSYTEFVSPYLPPSTTIPNLSNVDQFLLYFDEESDKFFEDNLDKLAYLQYQALSNAPGVAGNDITPWESITPGIRKAYAVKTLLTFGPLRGGVIMNKTEEDGSINLEIQSQGQRFSVQLKTISQQNQFARFMDQIPNISNRLNTVTLPESPK